MRSHLLQAPLYFEVDFGNNEESSSFGSAATQVGAPSEKLFGTFFAAGVDCAFFWGSCLCLVVAAPAFHALVPSHCTLPGATFAFGRPGGAGVGALIGCSFGELRVNLHAASDMVICAKTAREGA
jgi:hypothetical protein